MPDDAGWRLQNSSSRPTSNSLVAANVRWCAVGRQPPFDVGAGAPFRGDVLSRNSTGWIGSLILHYSDLVSLNWRCMSNISISRQIYLWVSRRRLFLSVERGRLAHHPPICSSTKGGWRRQICRLTSRNTQYIICTISVSNQIAHFYGHPASSKPLFCSCKLVDNVFILERKFADGAHSPLTYLPADRNANLSRIMPLQCH